MDKQINQTKRYLCVAGNIHVNGWGYGFQYIEGMGQSQNTAVL